MMDRTSTLYDLGVQCAAETWSFPTALHIVRRMTFSRDRNIVFVSRLWRVCFRPRLAAFGSIKSPLLFFLRQWLEKGC